MNVFIALKGTHFLFLFFLYGMVSRLLGFAFCIFLVLLIIDKAMDLILNFGPIQILTSFQSMGIKIYCTLKVKEANSNDVVLL